MDYAGKLNAAAQAATAAGMTIFTVRRRQRFLRRRTQSGQCRSALVVALRHRLRRHQEAAWRRRRNRLERFARQPQRQRHRRRLLDHLHADAALAGRRAARPGTHGPRRRRQRRPEYRVQHHRPRQGAVVRRHQRRRAALCRPLRRVRPQAELGAAADVDHAATLAEPDCFTDIVTGDNGFFRAMPGPDPCTGLGSPIGIKLAALFNAAPAAASVHPAAEPHAAQRAGDRRNAPHRRVAARKRPPAGD